MEDNTNIEIHDFKLNYSTFEGWFYDDAHTVCKFSLRHTSSGNWDSYDDWGYSYYDDYYYDGYYSTWAKGARSITNDSINANMEKPVVRTHKKTPNE